MVRPRRLSLVRLSYRDALPPQPVSAGWQPLGRSRLRVWRILGPTQSAVSVAGGSPDPGLFEGMLGVADGYALLLDAQVPPLGEFETGEGGGF